MDGIIGWEGEQANYELEQHDIAVNKEAKIRETIKYLEQYKHSLGQKLVGMMGKHDPEIGDLIGEKMKEINALIKYWEGEIR